MIRISRSVVPNSFTVGNMLFGYLSMFFAVEKDFVMAAWMIGLAAFLDAVDGKVARITNSSSKFGVEYDSLADVVSFGVAPSFLIYHFYFNQLDNVGFLFSFMPLLFGSIRLARFNVQLSGFTKTHFSGLPIPAAAITIISYIVLVERYFDGEPFPRVLMALTAIVSLLMVSNVRYEVAKISLKGNTRHKIILAFLLIFGICILFFPNMLIFPAMLLYIGGGLIKTLFMKTSERRQKYKEKRSQRSAKKSQNKTEQNENVESKQQNDIE
ncbi:MAG: CDP-diacylglycerol--serine O-phosphatidyltransferase [Calditrichaeota bacterium]|nr:MAG: CDP-diacylglycerol--serine O-phosphatidyltransferase [Calditrichota bacterium]MBL1206925.1 CDP-diacylglycerol--serine O-phosphatidyltransferase [Calditrichota bacterium]NOG46752.1 CDP-diacylglycerol--serine O-phosphatidyltransferase [Calditrichota bacterium]